MTDDQLASAYVIGTLPAEERHRLQTRMVEDQALAAVVARWEELLAPLVPEAEVKESVGKRPYPVTERLVPEALVKASEVIVEVAYLFPCAS